VDQLCTVLHWCLLTIMRCALITDDIAPVPYSPPLAPLCVRVLQCGSGPGYCERNRGCQSDYGNCTGKQQRRVQGTVQCNSVLTPGVLIMLLVV